jgi:hypothetical protein
MNYHGSHNIVNEMTLKNNLYQILTKFAIFKFYPPFSNISKNFIEKENFTFSKKFFVCSRLKTKKLKFLGMRIKIYWKYKKILVIKLIKY